MVDTVQCFTCNATSPLHRAPRRNYNAMVLNVPGAQQVQTRTGEMKHEAMMSSSC